MSAQQIKDFAPPDEGKLVAVEVDGTDVAVAVVDGELHAFDDTCPHAGCSLAEGELDQQAVVCPCHFARFDISSGAVLDGPTTSGIDVWSARLSDGVLELERRDAAPPADAAPTAEAAHRPDAAPPPRATAPAGQDAPAPPSTPAPPSPAPAPPSPAPAPPTPAPASPSPAPGPPTSGPDRDITVLIEREHDAFRRQFEALEGLSDRQELVDTWTSLVDLLEIHASGEEAVLYPVLVRRADDGAEEAEHAVRDHNEIRDSVRAVEEQDVGSDAWWAAVRTAREVNEDHLLEEESDVLPAFRDSVERTRREELGERWVAFHREHAGARGLSNEQTDPQTVVEAHEV